MTTDPANAEGGTAVRLTFYKRNHAPYLEDAILEPQVPIKQVLTLRKHTKVSPLTLTLLATMFALESSH